MREKSLVPIIMLTAKSDTLDIVNGLESGADDYIVKPFKHTELIARIKTRLRRTISTNDEIISAGELQIDLSAHEVKRGDQIFSLTPLEFDILHTLAQKPGQVFTREYLLEKIWGYRNSTDNRLINVHIQRLRSKIEKDPDNPEFIVTVRGIGYKMGNFS